jgi:hypothetical protein
VKKIIIGLLAVVAIVGEFAMADAAICGPYRVDFRDIDSNLNLTLPSGQVITLTQHGKSSTWLSHDGQFIFREVNTLNGRVASTKSSLVADGQVIDCD